MASGDRHDSRFSLDTVSAGLHRARHSRVRGRSRSPGLFDAPRRVSSSYVTPGFLSLHHEDHGTLRLARDRGTIGRLMSVNLEIRIELRGHHTFSMAHRSSLR